RALDFGQPEPVETYSSSPHLFEELNIPAGTKGRLTTAPKTQSVKTQRAAKRPEKAADAAAAQGTGDGTSRRRRRRSGGSGDSVGSTFAGGESPNVSAPSKSVTVDRDAEGAGTHDGK